MNVVGSYHHYQFKLCSVSLTEVTSHLKSIKYHDHPNGLWEVKDG